MSSSRLPGGSYQGQGSSPSNQNPLFVGLGGTGGKVPLPGGLQLGGSVVTAAATGNVSVGGNRKNQLFASSLDLPVPKEMMETVEALRSFINSEKQTMQEVQGDLAVGQPHAKELTKVRDDINRMRMEVHTLEHDTRKSLLQLESIKADVDEKKLITDNIALSMDSKHVVTDKKLCIATCLDVLNGLMADCKGRLEFLNRGISKAEQLYEHFGATPMSVADLTTALEVTKDSVKRFSAEMQVISEACEELSLNMYGTKVTDDSK